MKLNQVSGINEMRTNINHIHMNSEYENKIGEIQLQNHSKKLFSR